MTTATATTTTEETHVVYLMWEEGGVTCVRMTEKQKEEFDPWGDDDFDSEYLSDWHSKDGLIELRDRINDMLDDPDSYTADIGDYSKR